jgi:hypothetical protein
MSVSHPQDFFGQDSDHFQSEFVPPQAAPAPAPASGLGNCCGAVAMNSDQEQSDVSHRTPRYRRRHHTLQAESLPAACAVRTLTEHGQSRGWLLRD